MSEERTRAIVLRVYPLTETSLIIHWLGEGCGRVGTVAKGALRPKSPFRGKLDLYYEADICFSRSQRSELHSLREVVLVDTHERLRHEIGWLRQAAWCAALMERATESGTPLPGMFGLFQEFLRAIPAAPPRAAAVFAFELKLLNVLGLGPELENAAGLDAVGRETAAGCLAYPIQQTVQMAMERRIEVALARYLHGFLIYHLDRIPRGRSAALALEGD